MNTVTSKINLDLLWWSCGGDTKSSHGFSRADAKRLNAAICAPSNEWPRQHAGPLDKSLAVQYAESCYKDLRRASKFTSAAAKRDVQEMINNASTFPLFNSPVDPIKWFQSGSACVEYVLYAPKLLNYLRISHAELAKIWLEEIDSRIQKVRHAESAKAKGEVGDFSLGRIASWLTSAANQAEAIFFELSKIDKDSSGQGPKTHVVMSAENESKKIPRAKKTGSDPFGWTGAKKLKLLQHLLKNSSAKQRKSIVKEASKAGAGKASSIQASLVDLHAAGWMTEGEMGTCLNEKGIKKTKKKLGNY